MKPVQGKRQSFKVPPKVNVILDDRLAELTNLEQGQQAQIRYVIKKDRERARNVSAFSAGATTG